MKPNNILSSFELEVVRSCLFLSMRDDIFPNWEFPLIMGVSLEEVASLASTWPEVDLEGEVVNLALTNILANIVGYPHKHEEYIVKETNVSLEEISEIYRKIKHSG